MHSSDNTVITNILHLMTGGGIGLISASLAMSFGWRSADRLPGESRKPQCVYCARPSTWQENFPLIGWLLRPDTLSFPCPCGQKKGLWQQPACEIAGFILGAPAMYFQDWSLAALPLCIGIGLMPAIALIDFHFGVIPDELNILLGSCGFLFILTRGSDVFMGMIVSGALLLIGLFFALVYSKWRGREMLGLGDVKFFAAAGIWIHAHTAPTFLALSGAFGLVFTLLWRRISDEKQFPFAPALCLSLAICILYRAATTP
ncbi:MAG: A24 family peptidase [Bdellovibrionales bacterium]